MQNLLNVNKTTKLTGIYFFDGCSSMKLLTSNLDELKRALETNLTIEDSYFGILNEEILEILNDSSYRNESDLIEDLTFASMGVLWINPSFDELVNVCTKTWGIAPCYHEKLFGFLFKKNY